MTDTVKKVLIAITAVAALALGGSAIAGAVSGSGSTDTEQSGTTAQEDSAGPESGTSADKDERAGHGQRSDETLLTGDTATKVTEAAQAEVPGGTIERVETDAEGNAAYEAHMVKSDGSKVTVYVNEQFEVASVESGPAGHPRGEEQGDDSAGGSQQNGANQGTNA